MSLTVARVHGREVLDSRGNPTVEVELELSDGSTGRAIVPSGASKGEREALELRDGDKNRFLGKGVLKAVANVNDTLGKLLKGRSIGSLRALDMLMLEMDGTSQKEKLGGNAILGVSLAYAHALAASQKRPLFLTLNELMGLAATDLKMPVPLMNILNGGQHANNGLEIQEFMIVPHGFEAFSEALRAGCEILHHLKKDLAEKKLSTAVGDEGGFAPALESNRQALELITAAIERAGYTPGEDVALALDVAASSFFSKATGRYEMRLGNDTTVSREQLIDYYQGLLEKFPIVSIEDGLDENDWDGWREMTRRFTEDVQLVGDDIFVTQTKWVKKGIDEGIANAVLIKVNQVGSLTETFETMRLCRENDYRAVVSHRSGETEDVTISHLAVASGCGQIKTGSASRGERTAKYNELLRIEEWSRTKGSPIPLADPFSGYTD